MKAFNNEYYSHHLPCYVRMSPQFGKDLLIIWVKNNMIFFTVI